MTDDAILSELEFTPNIRCEANSVCVRAAQSYIRCVNGCPSGAVCQPCLDRLASRGPWSPVKCSRCGTLHRSWEDGFTVVGLVAS